MSRIYRRITTAGMIAMLAVSSWATTTLSQKPADPRLKRYYDRCDKMKADIAALPAGTTSTIVLLGDSITQAHPAKELAGLPVINEGIGGDQIDNPTSSTGVRTRLQLVADARPSHVFLMIGINDLWWSGKSLETAKSQYTELVKDLIKAVPAATIHLQSVLPSGGKHAKLIPNVIELNKHIQQLAQEHRLDYLDLFPLMKDEKGELRADLSTDGIHLKPEGYKIWISALEQRLQGSPGSK